MRTSARHALHLDPWALYVVMTDTSRPVGVVQIGVSSAPLDRIGDVSDTCPYPVVAAKWAYLRTKRAAHSLERRVRAALQEFHLRGAWYEFDYSDAEHKRRLATALNTLFEVETGRAPQWQELAIKPAASEKMNAEQNAISGLAFGESQG